MNPEGRLASCCVTMLVQALDYLRDDDLLLETRVFVIEVKGRGDLF